MRREPTVQTIKASEARQQFSQLLNRVFRRETRVIVEKSGVPVAAIISAQDLAEFNRFEAQREKDFAIVEEIRAAFKDIPDEELEREVARAVTEARARLREEAKRDAPAA